MDALLPHQGHTILHTIDSVRDLGKVTFAQSFVFLVEGAVIAASQLQVIAIGEMEERISTGQWGSWEVSQPKRNETNEQSPLWWGVL